VRFSALGDRTRVAVVTLAIGWLDHVALHEQRGFFHEGVEIGRVRIRNKKHVGSFDSFPAGDGRTVERMTCLELVHVKMRYRNGHMLFLTSCIGKTEVYELDFIVLHHLQDFCGCLCHADLLNYA